VKYAWVHEHRGLLPACVACRVLEVSTFGYCVSIRREPSARAGRTARIRDAYREVHAASHGVYGSVKVTRSRAERSGPERACHNTVAKTMRERGLKSLVAKAFLPTAPQVDPSHAPAPNTLAQAFTA
jgi:putative transposase